MAGKCGKREGAGRPKGAKDKINRNLKENILEVWDKLEAEGKGLKETADEKGADWFYVNFVKGMLPKDVIVGGDPDNPLETKVTVEFRK